MAATQTAIAAKTPSREDFAALLEESFHAHEPAEGAVVKGTVVAIEKDLAVIDVGLKVEGRVPLKEFGIRAKDGELKPGDEVEVYLERVENALGEAVLSREKARREESWVRLEEAFERNETVTGQIFNQVKGGFTVDLDGAVAFLPRSQVDVRPVRDVGPLMQTPQPFRILKMDKRRGNIVVSRRSVLEDTLAEQRSELVGRLREGQIVEGVVKNITEYGAFVELEPGIEGLIHVSEMSWTKKNVHPGKIVSTSQEVEVMVLEVDSQKRRISLGLKQTMRNPWEVFAENHPAGSTVQGEVKNKTEFGLFLGLEGDVDGMVHLSDLDWDRPGEQAIEDYKKGEMVDAVVLDVDVEKERISLGIKQVGGDKFAEAIEGIRKGQIVTAEVVEVKDSGIEVRVADTDLTAFIRRAELSRERSEQRPERFAPGEKVDARVTNIDKKARRLALSIKALEIAEEKEAVAQYGSTDSGASLGDILGAALRKRQQGGE